MHLLKDRGYADQETSYSIQRTMTMVINLFDEKLRINNHLTIHYEIKYKLF
jgi:hypothetical protein